jgi:hypothetical protein
MPLAAVAVVCAGIVVLGAIAFAGGFDRTTTARVHGGGPGSSTSTSTT